MKRFTLSGLLLAAAVLPATLQAEVLSPEQALGRAVGLTRSGDAEYKLTKTFNTVSGEPAVYLFCDKSAGVAVSADDAARPLLAILDNASDIDNPNPAFNYWMGEYSRQIEWLRANAPKSQAVAGPTRARADIGPLLTTRWDQGAPYNDFSPRKGDRGCYTGCVATALTQVMNYHEWPLEGKGYNKYTSNTNNFTLDCDFSTVDFDWANMADAYQGGTTDDQDYAVADLMYAVGVALWMDYGTDENGGSGAYTENVPYALVNYFNYDKSAHVVYRDAMPYAEWEQLVYDQLSLGPVYYAGSSDDGAHAYVCDGYSDGYFHINWGWGGSQNGYYLLTAMFPGSQQGAGGSTGSYDFEQMIVADIKKPQDNSAIVPNMLYAWGNWLLENDRTVERTSVARNSPIGIAGWAQNRSIEQLNFTAGIQIESTDGKVIVADAGHYELPRYNPTFNNQDCFIYWLSATIPSSVEPGKYIIRPVYKLDGTSEWVPMNVMKCYSQAYLMEVTNNLITLSHAEKGEVEIEEMDFARRTVAGKSLKIEGKMSNISDTDYESCIRIYVYDINDKDKLVAQGGRRFLIVPAGETVDFEYESYLSADLPPADYMVWMADAYTGEWLGTGIRMTYEKASNPVLSAKAFTFDGDSENADNMNLDFTLTVKCRKGWFCDTMDVTIWTSPEDGSSGYYVTAATCDEFEMQAGETVDAKFHATIPDPIIGMRYIAGAWYAGSQLGNSAYFKIQASDVEAIEASEVVNVEVYTLSGSKVNVNGIEELPAGLYVIKTVTADGKVSIKKQVVK